MKHRAETTTRPQRPAKKRRGVTLTEVLMSLMIMGVGVSMVISLFPISVLRSIRASRMTNATMLKENAVVLLDLNPGLVFDPDGDGDLAEHVRVPAARRYIVDPLGFHSRVSDGLSTSALDPRPGQNPLLNVQNNDYAAWMGNDGSSPFTALRRYDGGVTFGYGNDVNANSETQRAALELASTLVKLGDGWTTVLDLTGTSVADQGSVLHDASLANYRLIRDSGAGRVVGVEFDVATDLTGIADAVNYVPRSGPTQLIPDPEISRIVLYSEDLRFSQAFPITAISGQAVLWTEDLDLDGSASGGDQDLNQNSSMDFRGLPPEFLVNDGTNPPYIGIGRVRIQTSRTHEYSWMLTVRRGADGRARGVDVVILYRDEALLEHERIYPASFVKGNTKMAIQDPYKVNAGDKTTAAIHDGGYVLDVENARWYRIQDHEEIIDVSDPSDTTQWPSPVYDVVLQLEIAAIEPGGNDQDVDGSGDGGAGLSLGGAIFIPGVVDVFPLGSREMPQ